MRNLQSSTANGCVGRMMRTVAAASFALALLVLPAPPAAGKGSKSKRKFTVGYLDVEDAYTAKPALKKALKKLGYRHKQVGPSGSLSSRDQDVLLVGSFATSDAKARRFLRKNKERLAGFVKKGGMVVCLGQAVGDESQVDWLPEGLAAIRSNADAMSATSVDPQNPLLAKPHKIDLDVFMMGEIYRGKRFYAPSAVGGTDLFASTHGFATIVAAGPHHLPLAMVGRHGTGGVVLLAASPDRICVHGDTEAAREQGCNLLENAILLARNRQQLFESVEAKPFAAQSAIHTALVFSDLDGDGKKGDGEFPVEDVVVAHDLSFLATDANGEIRVKIDATDPGVISLRVPEGYRPTTSWFQQAGDSLHHTFGIQPVENGVGDCPPNIYQLSDVHIGRLDQEVESELFLRFMQQLARGACPGDLFAFTGDVTHTGSLSSLRRFLEVANSTGHGTVFAMGNHDWGKGPDWGRLYERAIAPAYYTREWNGHLIISLPSLQADSPVREWLQRAIASTDKPVVIVTHYYPKRRAFDRLPAGRVSAVLSGHWHGDHVSVRNGITSINSPTAIMGGWDFSPASARRILLGPDGIETDLVEFVKAGQSAVVVAGNGLFVANHLVPARAGTAQCSLDGAEVEMERLTPYSHIGRVGVSGRLSCRMGQDIVELQVECQLDDPLPCQVRRGASESSLTPDWLSGVPGRCLMASPRTHGDYLMVPFRDADGQATQGGLAALDRHTGEGLWLHHTGTPATTSPVTVGDTTVLVEADGTGWGLKVSSGKVVWTRRLDQEGPEPRFVDHYLHSPGFRAGQNVYYCYQSAPFGISARDGDLVWQGKKFGSEDAFSHARGVVVGDSLLCAGFGGGLYRYDLGKQSPVKPVRLGKWKVSADLSVRRLVRILTRRKLLQVDPVTGIPRTEVTVPYAIIPARPLFLSDLAVVPYGHEGIAGISPKSGKRAWRLDLPQGQISFALNAHTDAGLIGSPVAHRGLIYVPGIDGTLYVVNARDGKVKRKLHTGVPLATSPIIRDGKLYLADYAGTLYAFSLGDQSRAGNP